MCKRRNKNSARRFTHRLKFVRNQFWWSAGLADECIVRHGQQRPHIKRTDWQKNSSLVIHTHANKTPQITQFLRDTAEVESDRGIELAPVAVPVYLSNRYGQIIAARVPVTFRHNACHGLMSWSGSRPDEPEPQNVRTQ